MSGRKYIVICVAAVFASLAIGKLVIGHERAHTLPAWAYYGASLAELMIAALFLGGKVRVAALLGMMFCCVAMVVATVGPSSGCGCLGTLDRIGRPARFAVAGLLGLACCLTDWMELRSRHPGLGV